MFYKKQIKIFIKIRDMQNKHTKLVCDSKSEPRPTKSLFV